MRYSRNRIIGGSKDQIVGIGNCIGMLTNDLIHASTDPITPHRRLAHFSAHDYSNTITLFTSVAYIFQGYGSSTDRLSALIHKTQRTPSVESMSLCNHA